MSSAASMAATEILIVDDEADIREVLRYNLEKEGYAVRLADDGESAVEAARQRPPDLVLLDLMLPGIDGLEVCYKLRHDDSTRHVPIIMLTVRDEEMDEIIGLKMGADDYITKPFSPRLVLARVAAVLRRGNETDEGEEPSIMIGNLVIDHSRHQVTIRGKEVGLTPVEFRILAFLARKPGRVHTRAQIISYAQGANVIITERTVDVHVVALRRKLQDDASLIETVRGIGYRFREG